MAYLLSLGEDDHYKLFFIGYAGLSNEDVQDLFATAVKKMWESSQTGRFEYHNPKAANAWLRQRIRYEVTDHWRSQGRRCKTVPLDTEVELTDGSTVDLIECIASDDPGGDPVQCLMDLEERELVDKAADDLQNKNQRELVKRRLWGQPDPEGRTSNQINVDWHRATKKILKAFGKA